MTEKLEAFRALLQADQLRGIIVSGVDCEANRANCTTRLKPGRKYINLDVGSSGKYMIVAETGEIYGIKAYGVIHRGHYFGTLDTIADWDWSGYRAIKRKVAA